MKKSISIAFFSFVLSACSSMQTYNPKDMTSDGIKYTYGAAQGIKVGDKITAYNKRSSISRRGYSFDLLGALTVSKVETSHSYLQKDFDFPISENTTFVNE